MAGEWSNSGVDLHLELTGSSRPAAGSRAGAAARGPRGPARRGRPAAGEPDPRRRAGAVAGNGDGGLHPAGRRGVPGGAVTGSGTVVADVARGQRPGLPDARRTSEWAHDLTPGVPDVSTFPVACWLRASRKALNRGSGVAFDYGTPAGGRSCSEALTGYLGRARGVAARPGADRGDQRLRAGAGSARRDGRAGHRSRWRTPGLAFHREVVRGTGARRRAAAGRRVRRPHRTCCRTSGVRRSAARRGDPRPPVPTRRPAGPDASLRARRVGAAAAGGIVVEDDYDGEFRYDRQPVGALQAMAPDHVVYVGTASKTLAPALRLAWMVVPSSIRDGWSGDKEYADSHSESFGQLTLADLLSTHDYDRHVRVMRGRYKKRREQLAASGLELHGVAAGCRHWCRAGRRRRDRSRGCPGPARARGMRECYHGEIGERPRASCSGSREGAPAPTAGARGVLTGTQNALSPSPSTRTGFLLAETMTSRPLVRFLKVLTGADLAVPHRRRAEVDGLDQLGAEEDLQLARARGLGDYDRDAT